MTSASPDANAFGVFVSFAEQDRWWVEGFLLQALAQAGISVTTDTSFPLGVPRLREYAKAVTSSARTLVVLSPSYITSDLSQFVTVLAQQYGVDNQRWPVIPLTLRSIESAETSLNMLVGLDAT